MFMDIDYMIIGSGLAGLNFAYYCEKHDKSFIVIDQPSRSSSLVAGGMYNPVVLKRFTSIWKSREQIDLAIPIYKELEIKFGVRFLYETQLYRKFASVEEQNNWFYACDQPDLAPFLSIDLVKSFSDTIKSEYGFGEVFNTGFLDVKKFVLCYQYYLAEKKILIRDSFAYDRLVVDGERFHYKDIKAKHLIFAEGFSMFQNPYFNNLPLDGTKGELLIVRIPDLELKYIVKSSVFIIPLGNDLYKVGATYDWKDKTDLPTVEAKRELINGLQKLIGSDFEIIEHLAGVRPTVKDRKPLVGRHFEHENMYLLNGLGTRGVLLGPFLAKSLFDSIEQKTDLDPNIDIKRYYKKMQLGKLRKK